ncbi:hypothetical protein [Streptomyces sp. NPDC048639]|uniref:hypothetical protein n=1 Tax=Streptomyces sp. NPDC048639 TaxID=3365581 RepID=UPI00371B8433
MAAATSRRPTYRAGDGARPQGSASTAVDETARRAPRCELLAVIGPSGPTRAALLAALAERPWPQDGAAAAGDGHRIAVVRCQGAEAPDPRARVAELLAEAGDDTLAVTGLTMAEACAHGGADGALSPHMRYEHLSAADQLVVALALAVAGGPGAVVVDGADNGLDATGCHRVWSRLRRVAESGTTVVAASESAAAAGLHAHRTVLLPAVRGIGAAGGVRVPLHG